MRSAKCFVLPLVVLILVAGACAVFAQDISQVKPYVSSMESARKGMTLWQLIMTGGVVMFFIGLLSVIGLICVVYNFIFFTQRRLIPFEFVQELKNNLKHKRFDLAHKMCRESDNIIAQAVLAGLDHRAHGEFAVKEAVVTRSSEISGALWSNLNFISDIVVIAPLLGLLGTVTGMIQAFNVIVVQSAVVKPVMLAHGVSQAMITTAGGLTVAIPLMLLLSLLRSRLQAILQRGENYISEIMILIVQDTGKIKG